MSRPDDEESGSRAKGPRIESVAGEVHRLLGEERLEGTGDYGVGLHDAMAFEPMARRIAGARTRAGYTVASLARALHVGQYRIRQIEQARVAAIDAVILRKLIRHLQLDESYSAWVAEHPDVAARVSARAQS